MSALKKYYEFLLLQVQRNALGLYSHYIAPTTVNFLISKRGTKTFVVTSFTAIYSCRELKATRWRKERSD